MRPWLAGTVGPPPPAANCAASFSANGVTFPPEGLPAESAKSDGVTAGQFAAAAILAMRIGDGATVANIPYTP